MNTLPPKDFHYGTEVQPFAADCICVVRWFDNQTPDDKIIDRLYVQAPDGDSFWVPIESTCHADDGSPLGSWRPITAEMLAAAHPTDRRDPNWEPLTFASAADAVNRLLRGEVSK